ncbi:N-acetylmuramoyl-L-alanine amidase [Haloimpatiens massiliensis]|uniref:N-acetylmuramoyl-L-alanine amidase n=1 Tax=Haloimpatiens massiliensis TaxID=1658110 RepID=UPI000C83D944|nr:N-acetylmuramoyl-L-alanine amidase [Haloimpatiens massiliensis]
MKKKHKFLTLLFAFFIILGLFYCKTYAVEKLPSITSATIEKSVLQVGEEQAVKVKTDYTGNVQYLVYLYDYNTKKWTDLTGGYLPAVSGTSEQRISLGKNFSVGNYRITVRAKRAGQVGKYNNVSYFEPYDSYAYGDFTVKKGEVLPNITSTVMEKQELEQGQEQAVKVKTDYTGNVQYLVYLYDYNTKKWTDLTGGYLPAVSGTSEQRISLGKNFSVGNYRITVRAKRAGQVGKYNNVSYFESYDSYAYGDFTVKKGEVLPNITSTVMEKQELEQGQEQAVKVKTDYTGNVQYLVYLYDYNTKKWTDLTGEYLPAVSGTSEQRISLGKNFSVGNYRITVRAKRAGKVGKYNNVSYFQDYDSYAYGDFTVKKAEILPNIASATLDKSVLAVGEEQAVKVKTDYTGNVQYIVYLYDYNTKKWTDLTGGYLPVVSGTSEQRISLGKNFSVGNYRITVRAKRAGQVGKYNNVSYFQDYDSYAYGDFKVSALPSITSAVMEKAILEVGEGQAVKVKTDYTGNVQYLAYLYDYSTGKWTDLTEGYLPAVSGTSEQRINLGKNFSVGNYRITVRVKRAGQVGKYNNVSYFQDYDGYAYADFKVVTHRSGLEGKVIVIDPGHNHGGDYGAVGNGLSETELNMQTALKLKSELEKKGAKVILTRDPNHKEYLSVKESLVRRVEIANSSKADLFISIHHDSSEYSSAYGTSAYYSISRGNSSVSSYAIQKSKELAEKASSKIASLGTKNRGAHDRDLYVTKYTNMPSVLVEVGFISNSAEAKKISDYYYQLSVAKKLTEAVEEIFK